MKKEEFLEKLRVELKIAKNSDYTLRNYLRANKTLVDFIKKDPDNLSSYIQLLSASRYLERMADHATNIAEDVIYLITGEIIRHSSNTDEAGFWKNPNNFTLQ